MTFEKNSISESKPVVVIGSGVSGSFSAWQLKRQGIPVVLIEKSTHTGGRMQTEARHGCKFESGMQFYYSAYSETRKALRELGLETHLSDAHVMGKMIWEGRVQNFDKSMPWLSLLSAKENFSLWKAVGLRTGSLLGLNIFDFDENDPLDQVEVTEYFGRYCSQAVLELAIRPMVTSYSFSEPEGHSLAMLLRIIKLGALAKTYALDKGNDALPQAMANQVDLIRAEATAINIKNDQVESVSIIKNGRADIIHTNHVICALPPPSAMKLFDTRPTLKEKFSKIDYTCTIMVNFLLDCTLEGKEWVYTLSRHDGHQAAFAIDCLKRCPTLFPHGKSVIMVSFVNPIAKTLLDKDDGTIIKIALSDMKAYYPNLSAMVKEVSIVRRPIAVPSFRVGMFKSIRSAQAESAKIQGLKLVGDYLRAPLVEGAIRSAKLF